MTSDLSPKGCGLIFYFYFFNDFGVYFVGDFFHHTNHTFNRRLFIRVNMVDMMISFASNSNCKKKKKKKSMLKINSLIFRYSRILAHETVFLTERQMAAYYCI